MRSRYPLVLGVVGPLLAMAVTGCAAGASSSAGTAGSPAVSSSTRPSDTSAPSTSGQSPGGGVSGQSSAIHPGHDTPADAVDGYLSALLAGNAPEACSYIDNPNVSCPPSLHATGHVSIGATAISGAIALVEVTGSLCVTGSGCSSNNNPSAGMPTGSESVSKAYARVVVTGNGFSPVACIESSHGGWYIAVNGE